MIFVTVGTQVPFDRLIRWVDNWSSKQTSYHRVVCQVGNSTYSSNSVEIKTTVEPSDFENLVQDSDIIISHAGMGTIITAFKYKKPLIIVPRLSSLNEHRNDHQVDTADAFKDYKGIYCANDSQSLEYFLDNYPMLESGSLNHSIEYDELLVNLRSSISDITRA